MRRLRQIWLNLLPPLARSVFDGEEEARLDARKWDDAGIGQMETVHFIEIPQGVPPETIKQVCDLLERFAPPDPPAGMKWVERSDRRDEFEAVRV
jgi:hypothetical protein